MSTSSPTSQAQSYLTSQDDMADMIAYRNDIRFERLLEANPGLAEYGPLLPAGLNVHIPARIKAPRPSSTIRLWD